MNENSPARIEILKRGADLRAAFDVRREVFHVEQGIDEADDFDGKDKDADQFVAYVDDKPIATARVRYIENNTGKIERVATLKPYRGKNYGLHLMQYLLAALRSKGVTMAVLESQTYAAPFYEKLGFEKVGEEFEDVGIPHVKMQLKFDNKHE